MASCQAATEQDQWEWGIAPAAAPDTALVKTGPVMQAQDTGFDAVRDMGAYSD